jgi:hypothetical protein
LPWPGRSDKKERVVTRTPLSSINNSRPFFHPIVVTLLATLLLGGCASTKDAQSRNDIATLKTIHLAFIDEYTEGKGKTWDDKKLSSRIAAVEKQFAAAEQYETTKKQDARRAAAISNLHSQFKRNAVMLQRRKAFFRTAFATQLKDQVTQNYDQAVRGEDIRS